MSQCCLYETNETNSSDWREKKLVNYSIEGFVEVLSKELEETNKEIDFYQQKAALLNQVIEKLKS